MSTATVTNGSRTSARTLIAEYLEEVGEPRSLKDIEARTGVVYATASQAVKALVEKDGTVLRVARGQYQWVGSDGAAERVPVSAVLPERVGTYSYEVPAELPASALGYMRPDVTDDGPAPPPEPDLEASGVNLSGPSRVASVPDIVMIGARLEAIGFTDTGVLILRDAAGHLFTATRLTV